MKWPKTRCTSHDAPQPSQIGDRNPGEKKLGHISDLGNWKEFRGEIRMRARRRRRLRRGRRRRRRRPDREREQGYRPPRRWRTPPEPPRERRRRGDSSSLPPFVNRERNAENFWEEFLVGGLEGIWANGGGGGSGALGLYISKKEKRRELPEVTVTPATCPLFKLCLYR